MLSRWSAVPVALALLSATPAFSQIVINEALYRTNPTDPDPLKSTPWIELYNKGNAAVDLSGWSVTGSGGTGSPSARTLPALSLPSHAWLVIHFAAGNTTPTDYYTQDTAGIWNPDSDEAALYSTTGIVDFISWYDANRPYQPGAAHDAAVAANIWTAGAALNSDGVSAAVWERPRSLEAGMSIGRDPDSTDTDQTADFEPHGGVGALNNSPGRRNLDSVQIGQANAPANPAAQGGLNPKAAPAKKWTVLLYFDADNSLERDIFGNLQEVALGGSPLTHTEKPGSAGGSDANVNFVVMYDGRNLADGTYRGRIPASVDSATLNLEAPAGEDIRIGERDMADPAELAGFIAWAKASYPAEHYALILGAHGDGWKSWGPDESSVKNTHRDFLYMGELSTALQGQHFDLIGFDSCLMANIEVADQVHPYTDYLVASEQVVPGFGFPYDTFTAALRENPGWTGLDLGKKIVDLFAARYAALGSTWTLSLTDEQALPQLIKQIDTWSALLRTGAGLFQGRDNPADNAQILMKFDRLASTQFHDPNYVDLYDFAQRINNDAGLPDCVKTPIFQILNLISGSVVASQAHSAGLAAHGLQIYFPAVRKRAVSSPGDDDYDWPYTRATDGASHYAIYAPNNDMLPLKAIDREDLSALNPRTEWPEPPSPSLQFVTDTEWSRFLERFYHPVADNHILKGVSPTGEVLYPTTTASACFNGNDAISMPVGSTIYFSGAGSSDADQEPFATPPNAPAVPNLFLPSFYFWDLDSTAPCSVNCALEPQSVPPGAPADSAVTNMDADRDLSNTNFDQKDASGPAASVACKKEGTFQVTLMSWDDNHLKPFHDTVPNASYVHPQTDSHDAAITCTAAPPPGTSTGGGGLPLTAVIPVTLTVSSDPFDSASYVGLTHGTLTITIMGLNGNVRDGHLLPHAASPTISIKGDRPELVPAAGTFNTATNSFEIEGTSTGRIAGFSHVDARYSLALSGEKLDKIGGTYEVGLNRTLNNEAEPVTYKLTGTLTQQTYPAATGPAISVVQTIYGGATISQNAFIEIHGLNLVPSTTPAEGVIWSDAPEFDSGKMPTELGGVSVTIDGKRGFVEFFCSASTSAVCKSDQINVLTPLDTKTGPVSIVVKSGSESSPPFTVTMQAASPSFLEFTGNGYVTAVHADYSLLGPEDLYAGYTTPATPGEIIVLYATGFGLPSTAVTNGSSTQSGPLPSNPVCKVGTLDAPVAFAGIVSPGLAQLNVTVPDGAATSEISCTYGGATTPPGNLIAIHPR